MNKMRDPNPLDNRANSNALFGLEMKELKWKECEILFVKRKKIR